MSKLISIGNIIDYTWEHYSTHFKVLMRIALWLFLVTFLSVIVNILAPIDVEGAFATGATTTDIIFGILQLIVTVIITPAVSVWIFLTLLQAMRLQQAKKTVDTKIIGRASWKLFLPYLFVAFLKALAVLLPTLLIIPGTILLIYNTVGPQLPWLAAAGMLFTFLGVVAAFVGVVYAGVVFHFADYRLVFENTRGLRALREAKALVKDRFFGTLFRIVLTKLLFSIPLVVAQIAVVVLFALLAPSFSVGSVEVLLKINETAGSIFSTALTALFMPLFILSDYYVYDSLRKNAS